MEKKCPASPILSCKYLKDTIVDRPESSLQQTQLCMCVCVCVCVCTRECTVCTLEPRACQKELGTSWDWLAYLRQLLHCGAWILLSDSRLAPLLLLCLLLLLTVWLSVFLRPSCDPTEDSHDLRLYCSPAARQTFRDCLPNGRTYIGRKNDPQHPYLCHLFFHSFILLMFSFSLFCLLPLSPWFSC